MAVAATVETFKTLVESGPVLVDLWGPRCAPCIALMPAVEDLEQRYTGRFTLVTVNTAEQRRIAWDLKVMGLPTYITLRDGVELDRLTGSELRLSDIEAAVERMLKES